MTQLFTDTSANLPAEIIDEYGIEVVPFSYTIDGVEYIPEREFDGKAFYAAMRAGSEVKTSMVNAGTFIERFKAALDAGKDVLYIGMSGGISGTANAALMAKQELDEEYPDRKIVVIDTLAASLGEGLLVIKAAEQLRDGAALDADRRGHPRAGAAYVPELHCGRPQVSEKDRQSQRRGGDNRQCPEHPPDPHRGL